MRSPHVVVNDFEVVPQENEESPTRFDVISSEYVLSKETSNVVFDFLEKNLNNATFFEKVQSDLKIL